MKKLLPLLVLFLLAMGGRASAQTIVKISPDSVVADGHWDWNYALFTDIPPVMITVRGAHFITNPADVIREVQFNIPNCWSWFTSPPEYRNMYVQSFSPINDSTISVNLWLQDGILASWLDVTVLMNSGPIKKNKAFKIKHRFHNQQFSITPALGHPGQTLDVVATGLTLGGQASPTSQVSPTMHIDFGDWRSGTNFSLSTNFSVRQNADKFLANISVPTTAAPGCYDVIIHGYDHCETLNDAFCVTPGPIIQFPGTIRGTVFEDKSKNCFQESNEHGLQGVIMQAEPGPYYAITDSAGKYTMRLPLGTYTLSQIISPPLSSTCALDTVLVTVGATTLPDYNFGDTVYVAPFVRNPDIRINMHTWRMHIGQTTVTRVWLSNYGNVSMSGTVYVKLDTNLHYVSATPTNPVIRHDTLVFSFSDLPAGSGIEYVISHSLRPDFRLADRVLTTEARVVATESDDPRDNHCGEHPVINSSWDPNDKSVIPEGNITPSDSMLVYRIRFQNTGSDTAFTVVVRDTLSDFLDVRTIKMLGASHRNTLSLIGSNIAEVRFDNILLPDSNVNEPGSNGYFTFSINRKKSMPIGAQITNRAGIYFDFNPPVMTNTVTSLLAIPASAKNEVVLGDGIRIYPNPLSKNQSVVRFNTKTDLNGSTLVLRDVLGNVVYTSQTIKNNSATLDRSSLTNGLYFYQVQRGGKTLTTGKLAVE